MRQGEDVGGRGVRHEVKLGRRVRCEGSEERGLEIVNR